MARLRRSAHTVFELEDRYPLDLPALLAAELPEPLPEAGIVAVSAVTGERHRLTPGEFQAVLAFTADRWTDTAATGVAADAVLVDRLVDLGLLVSDTPDGRPAELRARDEALTETGWHPYAALYRFTTQWSGVDLNEGIEDPAVLAQRSRDAVAQLVERYGPPPPEIAPPRGSEPVERLSAIDRDGPLFQMLTARRTTRAFATGEPITVAELDAVLRYVFGCHGRGSTVPGVVCVKRTSPSGGGLHPIDAYPVVTAVDGIAPGVYHYDAGAHALSPVQRLPAADARQLATEFMAGQSYFGAAAVSIVLSARFDRNHWKYRRHPNAYAGILVDAGALIQTLYLVCTELGLGAFTTIALNGPEIERRLGLDGIHEGAIAIAGCGRRDDAGSPLEMPYGLA